MLLASAPRSRLARAPKSRLEYWLPKLRRNQERDEDAIQALRAQGWDVLVLWECQAAADDIVNAMVGDFLGDNHSAALARSASSSGG
jgi:DNA mismatch endonuclease (patch repair protein)